MGTVLACEQKAESGGVLFPHVCISCTAPSYISSENRGQFPFPIRKLAVLGFSPLSTAFSSQERKQAIFVPAILADWIAGASGCLRPRPAGYGSPPHRGSPPREWGRRCAVCGRRFRSAASILKICSSYLFCSLVSAIWKSYPTGTRISPCTAV